jgi:hypothetical protein
MLEEPLGQIIELHSMTWQPRHYRADSPSTFSSLSGRRVNVGDNDNDEA